MTGTYTVNERIGRFIRDIAVWFDRAPSHYVHPTQEFTVIVGPEFTAHELACISNGVMTWERLTHGDVRCRFSVEGYSDVTGRMVTFRKAYSTHSWVKEWEEKNLRGLLGMCETREVNSTVWVIMDKVTNASLEWVSAHEFGHVLTGPNHVDDKASLMSQQFSPTSAVTVHDKAAYDAECERKRSTGQAT